MIVRQINNCLKSTTGIQNKFSTRKPSSSFTIWFKKYSFFGVLALSGLTLINNLTSKTDFIVATTQFNQTLMRENPQLHDEKYIPTLYLPGLIAQYFYNKYFSPTRYIKKKQVNSPPYTLHYLDKHPSIIKMQSEGRILEVPLVVVVGGSSGIDQLMKGILVVMGLNRFQAVGIQVQPTGILDYEGLEKILGEVTCHNKGRKVYGVGVQYGANLMTLLAAKNTKIFDGIVSIGNPLDLQIAQQSAESSLIAKYTFLPAIKEYFTRSLKSANSKSQSLPSLSTKFVNNSTNSLISKESSQNTLNKAQLSSINYLESLQCPALFVHSKEDPFSINFQTDTRLENNPLCMFMLTNRGGHNQWLQGMRADRWVPKLVVRHLIALNQVLVRKSIQRGKGGSQVRESSHSAGSQKKNVSK